MRSISLGTLKQRDVAQAFGYCIKWFEGVAEHGGVSFHLFLGPPASDYILLFVKRGVNDVCSIGQLAQDIFASGSIHQIQRNEACPMIKRRWPPGQRRHVPIGQSIEMTQSGPAYKARGSKNNDTSTHEYSLKSYAKWPNSRSRCV